MLVETPANTHSAGSNATATALTSAVTWPETVGGMSTALKFLVSVLPQVILYDYISISSSCDVHVMMWCIALAASLVCRSDTCIFVKR